jgi:hypothetical protein
MIPFGCVTRFGCPSRISRRTRQRFGHGTFAMKLSGLIFSDGEITRCAISGDTATVHLVDYMNNSFVLHLSGADVGFNAESLGCNVHHHKLSRVADSWSLELFDEDNQRIFSARFSSATVLGPNAT